MSTDAVSPEGRAIHFWTHDVTARSGGIQSYSLAVIKALAELCDPRTVMLCYKNEPGPPAAVPGGFSSRCYGRLPARLRTAAFSAGVIRAAFSRRPRLILSAHPNFARIGVWTARATGGAFWTAAHGIDVWEDCPPTVVRALKKAGRILAVSEFTMRKMVSGHGIPGENISVLPNTFDARRFCLGEADRAVREEYKLPHTDKILLSVGRLAEPSRMKGFDKVIEAMPRILEAVPQARYVVGGTGPDRGRLERLARECGVDGRVAFLGFVPDERLAALYRACDAFVMPSKKEGFGIVFLEAMACGLPVVAGNVDASGEALLGGKLGTLVDPDSIEEIAAACVGLLARGENDRVSSERARLSGQVTEAFGPDAFRDALRGLLATHAPTVFQGIEAGRPSSLARVPAG